MRPLEGITILDLSRVLACPFASMILAELGAEVIKVEQPGTGDETRGFEPVVKGEGGEVSAYYMAFNRSKRSITVNLRSPQGQDVIRKLAAGADVVLENFPVGTLSKYGLDHAALRAANDRLVHVSCTGFGETGPYRQRKGYDTVFQAMAGIMSLTGERGGGPVKPGLPVADLTSGLWVAIAILAGLGGREESGQGSQVGFSMFGGQGGLRRPRPPWPRARRRAGPAMSISRCSTARSDCCRSQRRDGSRWAKCRSAWAPNIPAASRRPPLSAVTASGSRSPAATSTGRRCATCSGSRNGRPTRH